MAPDPKVSGAAAPTIDDLAACEVDEAVVLWEACGLLRPWNDPRADIRQALAAPSATILAGRVEGRLVATVMTGVDGHRGWVYYLAVAEDARGCGVGRAMMRAAERWAAANGAPKMNLLIRTDNAASAGFYEAIGYAPSAVSVLQRRLDGD